MGRLPSLIRRAPRHRRGVGGLRRIGAVGVALAAAALLNGCISPPSSQAESYRRYATLMQESGRFRTEAAPADAPYSAADLLRNFGLVIFKPEAQLERFYRYSPSAIRLSRWERPVRYALIGDGVTHADRRTVDAITSRLADLTQRAFLPTSGADANLKIFIVSELAREALARRVKGRSTFRGSITEAWINTLNPPCFALFETTAREGGEITRAAIFIKAELEPPLREACLLEEITQSMGPTFDHASVRPSIFNDDQEFIALTRHDEDLIKLLYHPRLKPGMTRDEAMAIAREIISDERFRARLGARF
ncbi:MAG: DUF2927 domain-containing protein [Neomegalonema sp.]|nr:DUF2927 domain-containing protein [Neomegalonema sp.]